MTGKQARLGAACSWRGQPGIVSHVTAEAIWVSLLAGGQVKTTARALEARR
jgi:hypothetical protein